ncbi:hypothetical protein O3M35_011986 [Rhynocoris fuscipes]|uniref:G-protein coupled receptors family 3 profile domain-containing protein n=1 Tax=Rhynocoris fuscipes TaxID=488301 RepID=A0AAW1CRX5_9HEMI
MKSGICIKKRLNSTENLASIERKSTVLIMAKSENIADLLRTIAEGVNILIAPLDGKYEPLQDIKAEHILIVLPSMTTFSTNINYTYFENVDEEILSRTEMSAVYSYRHYQIVSDILHLLENIKIYIKKHCNDLSICQSLPRITNNYTLPKISSSLINKLAKILKISSDASICTLLEQTTDGRLMNITSKDDDSSTIESDNIVVNRNHYDNSCINFFIRDSIDFNEVYSREGSVKMRGDSWVAALLSVCAVGIACCLAISVFIVVRLCKGDMLEGNPGFSFLMLFSMIIMYAAVLPYSFEVVDDHHYYTGVICGIKAIGTSLSYSLVFSVMLSRSVMLASCDEDGGFMSHVNGYLQTILCFFIAAVQIALTLQFWSINWLILTKEQCSAMTEGPLFLYLLTYDMFLLFLLLCMSPFIIRSKRNYHEGGYFAVSTFLCLLVWVGWTTGYALLPSWSDLFICVGLMATASVVLISVFIPRTYLMLTGIVRDHIVSTLPHSLSHTTTTSVLDVNYRSTQALYDSVNTSALLPPSSGLLHPTAQVNPNYYAERPTTPSTSKLEDRTTSAASNLYERYERSPSPLNVTRF